MAIVQRPSGLWVNGSGVIGADDLNRIESNIVDLDARLTGTDARFVNRRTLGADQRMTTPRFEDFTGVGGGEGGQKDRAKKREGRKRTIFV